MQCKGEPLVSGPCDDIKGNASQVGIKVSTRSVLAELLSKLGVPDEKFAATCVLVDYPVDSVRVVRAEE